MPDQTCVKCGGELDEGILNADTSNVYWSNRVRVRMFQPSAVAVKKVLVCLKCGYVEQYIDAEMLRRLIAESPK